MAAPTVEEIICYVDEIGLDRGECGVRLEMVNGIGIWEAMPAPRHQKALFRIETSIRPAHGAAKSCNCEHISDVLIRFPDGSLKRPDISIFCREPDEQDEAVTLVPEAVIEVVSKGYEAKDLVQGVPFYLSQGVKDVVVYNPLTEEVVHFRRDAERRFTSPVEISFECGCVCTV